MTFSDFEHVHLNDKCSALVSDVYKFHNFKIRQSKRRLAAMFVHKYVSR